MQSLIVVPKKVADLKPIEELLKKSNKVKSVKRIPAISNRKKAVSKKSAHRISESSLAKEWLSKEDERWDALLK